MRMTIEDFSLFKEEWKKVTNSLKNSGYDLSKIIIVETRE